MKSFLTIIVVFIISFNLSAQTIDRNVIASAGGYYQSNDLIVSYTIGEPVIYTLSTPNVLLTQGFQQPDSLKLSKLMVKAYLEGSYLGNGMMYSSLHDLGMTEDPTATDSIEIGLWSQANLNNVKPDFSDKVILHNNGIANATFNEDVIKGKNYFIQIKHRNSIETWSSLPIDVVTNSSYDFSDAQSKAFSDGINPTMQNMGDDRYALYSGDINQDGTVDGQDMNDVDNNTALGVYGYYNSDVNGDGATDGLDMNVVDNNTRFGLFMARPY